MAFKKPVPIQGSRGTPASRRMQRQLAGHILELTKNSSLSESAELTDLKTSDIKNQRAGNMPSLAIFLCVVKKMRLTPESMLEKGALKKLHGRVRTQGAELLKIRERIQAICRENDAKTLAKATNIPISNIYQTRTHNAKVGLHTFLSIVSAGFSADALLLGTPKISYRLPNSKDSPQPKAKETAKETAKTTAKTTTKKAAKKVAKKVAKKAAKTTAKATAKKVAKKSAKPTAKPTAKKVAKKAANTTAKATAKKAAKPSAKSTAKPTAKKAAKKTAKTSAKTTAKKIAKTSAKKTAKKAAKATAKKKG